jgi:hypothetical protein
MLRGVFVFREASDRAMISRRGWPLTASRLQVSAALTVLRAELKIDITTSFWFFRSATVRLVWSEK